MIGQGSGDVPALDRESRADRIVERLASLVVFAIYRSVDVYALSDQVTEGPQLTVANHFGGFADPLLVVDVMPRMPRILARDRIWRVPVAGWVMTRIGAIPVHKPDDHAGEGAVSRNEQMFSRAYAALEDDEHVMIFPEGITRDDPSIAPIKTGAARVALGARARGVQGLRITPVGIHYEDKASLRSRVSIQIGEALDLDTEIDSYVDAGEAADAENRAAVRRLTDEIERRLRRVAPDFRDWEEARSLTEGAEVLLRTLADDPAQPLSIAERDWLAGYLGRRPPEVKERIVREVDDYLAELQDLGIEDDRLVSGVTSARLTRDLFGSLGIAVLLAPFALVGVLVNWLPYLLVKAVGLLRVAPAVLATLKPLTALLAFGTAWGLAIWGTLTALGGQAAALVAIMMPFYLGAVIVVQERFVASWRALRAWLRSRATQRYGDALRERRSVVVESMVEAL